MPAPLSSIDHGAQMKNSHVIWQGAGGHGQLVTGVVVVEVAPVKMSRQRKVRIGRIRFQMESGIDRSLRQGQPVGRMIQPKPIDRVMRVSQSAIRKNETG